MDDDLHSALRWTLEYIGPRWSGEYGRELQDRLPLSLIVELCH